MKKLSDLLLKNWDASRLMRLVLGIVLAIAYVAEGQGIYLGLSIFLLVQAIMNIGCGCAGSNCQTGNSMSTKSTDYEIHELNEEE